MSTLRRMEVTDLEVISALEMELFSSPWKKEHFVYELEENTYSRLYVMEENQEIIGYAGLWLIFENAELTTIGIVNKYQGQGYGRQLMNYLLQEARQEKCEYMLLEVRVSNIKAQKLYESLGFSQIGIKKNYYTDNGEDAISMVKILAGDEDETY